MLGIGYERDERSAAAKPCLGDAEGPWRRGLRSQGAKGSRGLIADGSIIDSSNHRFNQIHSPTRLPACRQGSLIAGGRPIRTSSSRDLREVDVP